MVILFQFYFLLFLKFVPYFLLLVIFCYDFTTIQQAVKVTIQMTSKQFDNNP